MKREITPSSVSDVIPFSYATSEWLESQPSRPLRGCTLGQISKDGTWAWLANGPSLEVVSTESGERLGACYFGVDSKSTVFNITCACELSSSNGTKLIVGLECGIRGGFLGVFDIKTSKIIRGISMPCQVMSVGAISTTGGANYCNHVLHKSLRFMYGIAAVGMVGCSLFLVDLCLDDEGITDDTHPSSLHYIDPRDPELQFKRAEAAIHHTNFCISLNDSTAYHGQFKYKATKANKSKTFKAEKILHLELDSSDSVVCAEEADSHTADSLLSDVAMQVDTTNSGPVKLKKSGLEHPCSMVFKTLPPKEKTPEREESRSLSPDNSSSNSKFTTPESSSVVSLQTARSRLSAESNASFSLSISLHSANSPTRDSSLQVAAATVVTSVPNVSEVAIASSTISSTCSTASQQSHTENQSLDSTLSLPSESPSPACLQTVSSTNGTPVSPVSCHYSPSKETLQIPDKSVMSNDSFVSRRSQGSVCQSPCQSIRASTPEGSPVSVATKESPSLVPQDDLPSPVMHIVEDAKSDTSKTNTAQGIKPFFSTDGSSVSSTTDLKEVYLEFANEKTISPQLQIEEEKNTELEDATIVMQVNTSPLYLRLKSQNSSPTTANSENLEMLIVKDASYESQEKMLSQKHISESEAYVEQHIEKEMSHCGTFVSTSSEKAPLSDESVKFNKHKKSDCMKKTTEPEAPQPMDTEVYNITEKSVKAMDITPPETPKKRENKSSSTRGTTEKSTRQMPRLIPVTSPNTKFVSKTRSKLRIASPEGNKSRAEIRSPSPHHTVTPKTLTGSTDSPKQAAKSSPTVVVASPVHTYNTRLHSSSPESRPSLGLKDAERPEARSTLEKKLPEFKEKSSMKSARRPVTRACMSSSKKKMDIASVKPAYSPGQQKIEFSFSPPTTVSTDRVTDDHPLTPVESKPFIFSPPLTRSRSRRGKRLSETDIVSSETTVGTTDDGGISTTRTLDGSKKRVAGRKSVTRSRRMMHSPEAVGSDSPINFVSPAAFNKEGKSTSSVRRSQRSLLQEAPQRRPAVFGHSRKKAYIW